MSNPTGQSIHAHDIMGILAETPLARAKLFEVLSEIAGPDPLFHTCSLQDQTFDEILAFLKGRNKIEELNGILYFIGQACGH